MSRFSGIVICAFTALLLIGCSGKMTPEERAERTRKEAAQALRDAASPEAMWYRFTFDAEYQGEAVKLDQMVYCPRRSFSGGKYGQTPGFSIRQQHPMTIAQKMDDGSQVLVRIPDMCKRYRKYKLGDGFQNGWISQGPFEVMPYVVWSDKVPKAERIEGYVSPAYYDHPKGRLKNPKGYVHLLPLGSHPENFVDVLKQEHAIPYSPNPWINPGRPNSDWFARNGRYNDPDNQFVSLYQIPIVDMNAYAEKYKDTAEMQGKSKLYPIDEKFSDPNITAYHHAESTTIPRFAIFAKNDLSYISADCVGGAASDAMRGRPIQSNMPFDPQDYGSRRAVTVRIKGSPDSKDTKLAERVQFTKKIQNNCRDRLAELQSFEIANGRFDASGAVPGVVVYRRWGRAENARETKEIGPVKLLEAGLVVPEGYKMVIDGHQFLYPVKEYGATISPSSLFENRKSGQWYMVQMQKKIFAGEGEGNHF